MSTAGVNRDDLMGATWCSNPCGGCVLDTTKTGKRNGCAVLVASFVLAIIPLIVGISLNNPGMGFLVSFCVIVFELCVLKAATHTILPQKD